VATRTIADGGGNWHTAGTWAEGAVPTSADDVVATATSGNVTLDADGACRSIDLTGYTGTLSHSFRRLTVGTTSAPPGGVAVKFPAGWTYDGGSSLSIYLTGNSGTTKTADFGGKSLATIYVDTNTATTHQWVGAAAFTTGQMLVWSGASLNTNGVSFTCDSFEVSSSNSVITLGSSTITVTEYWIINTLCSLSAASSTIVMQGWTLLVEAAHTYGTIIWTGSGGSISGALTCASFTLAIASSSQAEFILPGDVLTVTGTLTLTGWNATYRHLVRSDIRGVPRTITAAAVSITNMDFADIIGAGAATWTGTKLGDCGGNSGITFTAPVNRYWVGGTGTWDQTTTRWSATSGGSSGASTPLPQDTAFFDASSFTAASQVVTIASGVSRLCTLNFTGATNTPALTWSNTVELYGSLTLISAMTLTGPTGITLCGRGTHTITTAGKDMVAGGTTTTVAVDAPGGTWTLADNYLSSSTWRTALLVLAGTFNAATYNVTLSAGGFGSTGNTARTVAMGSGTWTIGHASGVNETAWNVSGTNVTVNPGTSTILLSASSSVKTFAGGGKTYHNLTITGTSAWTFTGSNTFAVFTIGAPRTVKFTAGTTTTVGTFVAVGTAGNVITIESVTAATHTLSQASGTVASDYLSLRDSAATGGAAWYAGSHSTNVTGNTGWSFTDAPGAVTTKTLAALGVG
jgi:hypothetical protein